MYIELGILYTAEYVTVNFNNRIPGFTQWFMKQHMYTNLVQTLNKKKNSWKSGHTGNN